MKKYLRQIKRFVNQKVGTISDELFWKFRHILGKDWAKSYISEQSINHPHRTLLIQKISTFQPINAILEVGCASGPNLFLLAQKYPNAQITGIDISRSAVKMGENWFKQKKITNVRFLAGKAYDLKKFADKSFDVVFSDASLIYLDPKKIKLAIEEIVRVSKKAIIINEFHTEQSDYLFDDHWIYNWKKLFKEHLIKTEITVEKLQAGLFQSENWDKYGHMITISLINT